MVSRWIRGTHLIEIKYASHGLVQPHRIACGFPELGPTRIRQQRYSQTKSLDTRPFLPRGMIRRRDLRLCMGLRGSLPFNEVYPRYDVAPLIAPSYLDSAAVLGVEMRKVISLQ